MSQHQQLNWNSGVLGFCSRVFSPARADGKLRGGRLWERPAAEDGINTHLCASEHNRVCLCLLLWEGVQCVLLPLIAEPDPLLHCSCIVLHGGVWPHGWPGEGHLGLMVPCGDSHPRACWRSRTWEERGVLCAEGWQGSTLWHSSSLPDLERSEAGGTHETPRSTLLLSFEHSPLATPCIRTGRGKCVRVLIW